MWVLFFGFVVDDFKLIEVNEKVIKIVRFILISRCCGGA